MALVMIIDILNTGCLLGDRRAEFELIIAENKMVDTDSISRGDVNRMSPKKRVVRANRKSRSGDL